MSEFGRAGDPLPHDQASTGEHFKEEELHHEREAERVQRRTRGGNARGGSARAIGPRKA